MRFLFDRAGLLVLAAGLRDFGQRIALELHVTLGDVEQLGQFIVPLLEQHINVGPGLINVILDRNQTVVNRDQIDEEAGDGK